MTVKEAEPPSVIPPPAATLTSGTSSSETFTVAAPWVEDTV